MLEIPSLVTNKSKLLFAGSLGIIKSAVENNFLNVFLKMKDVIFIFVGAILTFLSLWIIEEIKFKKNRKEKRENFELFVSQEFFNIAKILERLKIGFEYRNWFEFATIIPIRKNIEILEKYRKDSIYFSSFKSKEAFINLLSDLSAFIESITTLENVYLEEVKKEGVDKKETNNFYDQKRAVKLIDLIEIQRRIENFTKNI